VAPSPPPATWTFGDGFRNCNATNRRTRKEVTQLSAAERTALTTAWQAIIANGVYADISSRLFNNVDQAFGGAQFLPWHRLFLLELEDALRSVNPSVVLPYWQWTENFDDPALDPIFGKDLFGGAAVGKCIPDGPFADLRANVPDDHCVRREFNAREQLGMDDIIFDEAGVLAQFLDLEYADFEGALEMSAAFVNLGVGGVLGSSIGDMGVARTSANDPISFVHQAFVDKIWADWQGKNGATGYGGEQNGRKVAASDTLAPFGVAVSATFNLPCVAYAGASAGRSTRESRSVRGGRISRGAAVVAVKRARANRAARLAKWVAASPVSKQAADKGLKAVEKAAIEAVVEGMSVAVTVTAADKEAGASGGDDDGDNDDSNNGNNGNDGNDGNNVKKVGRRGGRGGGERRGGRDRGIRT